MLNPVLLISAVIAIIVICVGNLYVLVYFQHEEDKNQAYFPKAVVLIGLFLAEMTVLMLPFDVAISGSGELHRENMEVLWQVMYMILAFFLVVILPFALYYYESWDPEDKNNTNQLVQAAQVEVCTIIVVVLMLVLMYFFLGVANVPVWDYSSDFVATAANLPNISFSCPSSSMCSGTANHLELGVTFPVYTMGLISFVGWFFFVLFASVGLAALPLDLFSAYRFRPRRLPLDEFVKAKLALNKHATALKDDGQRIIDQNIHRSTKRKHKKIYNEFRKRVYFLELDFEKLQESSTDINPLVYWGYLLLSICTFVFTICWLLHILLFMFLDPEDSHPFLNNLFVELDSSFAFLGTVFYGAFSFYLIWATIKGNMKIGLRFLIFSIHPMKLGATMMNSFLFNVALILLCSVPVVQFCATAFSLYAHDTAIESLFGIQVTNLKFLRYFFVNNVFLYALFILTGLTFLYLCVFPYDARKRRAKEAERDAEDGWMAM